MITHSCSNTKIKPPEGCLIPSDEGLFTFFFSFLFVLILKEVYKCTALRTLVQYSTFQTISETKNK